MAKSTNIIETYKTIGLNEFNITVGLYDKMIRLRFTENIDRKDAHDLFADWRGKVYSSINNDNSKFIKLFEDCTDLSSFNFYVTKNFENESLQASLTKNSDSEITFVFTKTKTDNNESLDYTLKISTRDSDDENSYNSSESASSLIQSNTASFNVNKYNDIFHKLRNPELINVSTKELIVNSTFTDKEDCEYLTGTCLKDEKHSLFQKIRIRKSKETTNELVFELKQLFDVSANSNSITDLTKLKKLLFFQYNNKLISLDISNESVIIYKENEIKNEIIKCYCLNDSQTKFILYVATTSNLYISTFQSSSIVNVLCSPLQSEVTSILYLCENKCVTLDKNFEIKLWIMPHGDQKAPLQNPQDSHKLQSTTEYKVSLRIDDHFFVCSNKDSISLISIKETEKNSKVYKLDCPSTHWFSDSSSSIITCIKKFDEHIILITSSESNLYAFSISEGQLEYQRKFTFSLHIQNVEVLKDYLLFTLREPGSSDQGLYILPRTELKTFVVMEND